MGRTRVVQKRIRVGTAYRETAADIPGRAVAMGVTVFLGCLLLGLLLQAAGGPWSVWVPLWWVGALLTWRVGAGCRLRDLLSAPVGTRVLDFTVAFGIAALGALGPFVLSWMQGRVDFSGQLDAGAWLKAGLVAVVAGVLLNAVPEELTMRGVLQRLLGTRLGGPAAALLVGAAFGLAHLPTLLAGTMGLDVNLAAEIGNRALWGAMIGWAAWRLGSVWFPLGWHVGGNLVSVLLAGLGVDGIRAGLGWGEVFDPILLVGALAVLVLSRRADGSP